MLFEATRRAIESRPDRAGIRAAGQTQSYYALMERAERLAGGLIGLGIGRGTPVATLLPNSAELFVVAQALFASGAICVPLDLQATAHELERALRQTRAKAIVTRPQSLEMADQLGKALGLKVIVAGSEGALTLAGLEKAGRQALPHARESDIAVYLMSSGSTGRPKVVPRTHGEMAADAFASREAVGYADTDVMLNLLPAHHAFGFVTTIAHAPVAGMTTLLWADPQPIMLARDRLLHFVAGEGATLMPGVPFLFDLLAGSTETADLGRLRLAYSAAIGLKRASFDRFRERFGIALRQAYGCTETSLVSFNAEPDPTATWNSVGKPVGDTRIELLEAEESEDPDVGELVISSSSVTKGYLDNPEANAASFKGAGWISGDLGRLDAEGNIYLVGRRKLIIEVAGLKVDPVEVEDVLLTNPAIADVAIVGVPDPRTGEQRLKAVVVKKEEVSAEAVTGHARSRLSAHKVPYLIEFREALPRSATGKVLRGKLVD